MLFVYNDGLISKDYISDYSMRPSSSVVTSHSGQSLLLDDAIKRVLARSYLRVSVQFHSHVAASEFIVSDPNVRVLTDTSTHAHTYVKVSYRRSSEATTPTCGGGRHGSHGLGRGACLDNSLWCVRETRGRPDRCRLELEYDHYSRDRMGNDPRGRTAVPGGILSELCPRHEHS